jgi:hypothetical protein
MSKILDKDIKINKIIKYQWKESMVHKKLIFNKKSKLIKKKTSDLLKEIDEVYLYCEKHLTDKENLKIY